jgi:hypothetical protein
MNQTDHQHCTLAIAQQRIQQEQDIVNLNNFLKKNPNFRVPGISNLQEQPTQYIQCQNPFSGYRSSTYSRR